MMRAACQLRSLLLLQEGAPARFSFAGEGGRNRGGTSTRCPSRNGQERLVNPDPDAVNDGQLARSRPHPGRCDRTRRTGRATNSASRPRASPASTEPTASTTTPGDANDSLRGARDVNVRFTWPTTLRARPSACRHHPQHDQGSWANGYVGRSELYFPATAARRKVRHTESEYSRTGPSGSFESRTSTVLAEKATSTQVPPEQKVLRRQVREPSAGSGRAIVSFPGPVSSSHSAECSRCQLKDSPAWADSLIPSRCDG